MILFKHKHSNFDVEVLKLYNIHVDLMLSVLAKIENKFLIIKMNV